MDFKEYSKRCRETDLFPPDGQLVVDLAAYRTLCLCGEVGELANKVKKIRRDDYIITDENRAGIIYELGDIMWYLSILCDILDTDLEEVARLNIDKLASRKAAGKIQGNGDHRIAKDVKPDNVDMMLLAVNAAKNLGFLLKKTLKYKERNGAKYLFDVVHRRRPSSRGSRYDHRAFKVIEEHGFRVHMVDVNWDEQVVTIQLECEVK